MEEKGGSLSRIFDVLVDDSDLYLRRGMDMWWSLASFQRWIIQVFLFACRGVEFDAFCMWLILEIFLCVFMFMFIYKLKKKIECFVMYKRFFQSRKS